MKGATLLQKCHILRPQRAEIDWDHALPIETLEEIFGYLIDERDDSATRIDYTRKTFQPTFRAASLVCKTWYGVATRHLYKEIYLSSSKALECLSDSMQKSKHLRPLVRMFHFSSKIFASGNPQLPYTEMDSHCVRRICRLCPNLLLHVKSGMLMKALPADDDLALRTIKLDRARIDRLTFLEIAVPNDAFFGGMTAFSSESCVEFPALHTLYVARSWCSYHGERETNTPQWFRMPELRHLSLSDFEVKSGQTLTFPESPFLNTIELYRGDYMMVDNLFDPFTSPLLPFKETLQNLTITAKWVGEPEAYSSHMLRAMHQFNMTQPGRTLWSLDFLENLVELCLPFRSFANVVIVSYPPRLRELALVGYHWDWYEETPDVLDLGRFKLQMLLNYRQMGLRTLQRIRLMVKNIKELDSTEVWLARSLGIDVILGLQPYRLSDWRSDLINIGLKKLHLK